MELNVKKLISWITLLSIAIVLSLRATAEEAAPEVKAVPAKPAAKPEAAKATKPAEKKAEDDKPKPVWSAETWSGLALRGIGPAVTSGRIADVAVDPTEVCNLDCKYCFFLSKEMLYPGSRFRMAIELLETYIQQLLEAQPSTEVGISWQGGEPTLTGLDFFQLSVEYVEKYKKTGQQVLYTIQTNGTKIEP